MANQNAVAALAEGRCQVKENLKICLEGIRTLQQKSCSVKGQWILSHQNIPANKLRGKLADQGQNKKKCQHSKCLIAWLHIKTQALLMRAWTKHTDNPKKAEQTSSTPGFQHRTPRMQRDNAQRKLLQPLTKMQMRPKQFCPPHPNQMSRID